MMWLNAYSKFSNKLQDKIYVSNIQQTDASIIKRFILNIQNDNDHAYLYYVYSMISMQAIIFLFFLMLLKR